MTNAQSNLVKKQIMLSEENIKKIEKLSHEGNISASEITRLAIDSYKPNETNDIELPELMNMVSKKLKEAITLTQKASSKVEDALSKIAVRQI